MISSQRIIPAIYACRKQVTGLDDETTWRAFLARSAGTDSLRAMTGGQLGKVLDALHAAGAPKRTGKGAKRARVSGDIQHRMARGLWIELSKAGAIRDSSEAALDAFVKRMTGNASLTWCSGHEMNAVIEALKKWTNRHALKQRAVALAEALLREVTPHSGQSREQAAMTVLWDELRRRRVVNRFAMLGMWTENRHGGDDVKALPALAEWVLRIRYEQDGTFVPEGSDAVEPD